ncbi:MAG: HAD-IA family hydrolase [Lachnospiraceae bacterium]|nr:HAD-IA family hydrolase [Lachnospiraceae bacterium]
MERELIIFTDSGDTIIDESTQIYDDRQIVQKADFIPGADKALVALHEKGYRIALVADGELESFQNVYRENGLGHIFEEWIISEVVGKQKPEPIMFETALEKMHLGVEDKKRIVMIGNNLKKDIAGANRQGMISIWLDWSPRYFHTVEEPDWQPDYTVHTPEELVELLDQINEQLVVEKKINALVKAFTPILYEDDEVFLENMKGHNLAGDDIRLYQHWEWTQGVGLYGYWKLFKNTKEQKYLNVLTEFYDKAIETGFPAMNINTTAPYLAMAFIGEYLSEAKYLEPCRRAAKWLMEEAPRTAEGGFQHLTSDTLNESELWDDTLFMAVLFLAKMGTIENNKDYIAEAQYQFMLHANYLSDKVSGLWYHGWSFNDKNNFAGAFWGRGNCWVTMAIPELLSIVDCDDAVKKHLINLLNKQVDSLVKYQDESGMWHTLIDDADSYVEASATCGFAYGIMRAVHMGLLPEKYMESAKKALAPIISYISDDGVVSQVSYGTPMGRTTKDFYKNIKIQPMPYGQALAILFLMESKAK